MEEGNDEYIKEESGDELKHKIIYRHLFCDLF